MPPRPPPLPATLGKSFSVREGDEAGLSDRRMRNSDLDTPFHGVRVRADLTSAALASAAAEVAKDVSPAAVAARFH